MLHVDLAGETLPPTATIDEPAPPPPPSAARSTETTTVADRRSRWAHADFGLADLDSPPSPDFFRQLEGYVAQGHPMASVMLLEKAVQAQPGKSPWHLLMLLDLYSALRQARNQECVAAQLEALYNVYIPELHQGSAPSEGRNLVDQPQTLARVQAGWPSSSRMDMLASLLLHPVALEPLDLAAFRDLLLLHAVAAQLASAKGSDADAFNPIIDWSPVSMNPVA